MKQYLNNNFNYDSDVFVELYDEIPIWAAPFGLKLLENLEFVENCVALDIGFGTGFPLTEVAMRMGNEAKIFGIDPWEKAVKRAMKKLDFYNITNTQVFLGVAENIPLENNSVNLIISNNGLNNVSDIYKTLEECNRIMKVNGQLLVSLSLNTSMVEFYTVMKNALIDLKLNQYIEKVDENINTKRRSLESYLELISQNGFSIKNVEHDVFTYRFANGSALLNHHFIRLAFLDNWKSILPKDIIELVFNKIEDIFNQMALERGFIELKVPFVVINALSE